MQRDRANRADVRGDVFADRPIAARRAQHKLAALIPQIHREPVELELARVLDALRGAAGASQSIARARVERCNVGFIECIVQR